MPATPASRLLGVGWSDRVAVLLSEPIDRGLVPARVVGVARGRCRVVTDTAERSLPVTGMAVGDWVALDGDTIVETLARWSTLGRLDPDGGRQVLAANVDIVLVAAPADRLSVARVERELVVAWDSGARPVVVLTKVDLAPADLVEELVARLGTVDVITTSAVAGEGIDHLASLLVHPVTAAWLGPSGAGKSTLINALLGEERLAVGDVRDDRRGRHTTSSRQLVPLPSGGSLIDMPGLRSVGTDADDAALAATFPDIETLAGECRFADCTHSVEPGCAVVAAVAEGELDPDRVDNYRKLVRETAFEQSRTDALARLQQNRVSRTRTKALRRMYEERDQ